MTRDLNRAETNLINLGQQALLEQLLLGPLPFQISLPFGTLPLAKSVHQNLYNWLWFFPRIKEGLSLKLDSENCILIIQPKGLPEKRGRRGSKL